VPDKYGLDVLWAIVLLSGFIFVIAFLIIEMIEEKHGKRKDKDAHQS
jgi:hypothetical protein